MGLFEPKVSVKVAKTSCYPCMAAAIITKLML